MRRTILVAIALILSDGCRGTEIAPPQSGPVFDAVAAAAQSRLRDATYADVAICIRSENLRRNAATTRALVRVGYAVSAGRGLAFTRDALAHSTACAAGDGRDFTIARLGVRRPLSARYDRDGFGDVKSIRVELDDRSTPLGAFGATLARDGSLSCLDSAGEVVWRGAGTRAHVVVAFGLDETLGENDEVSLKRRDGSVPRPSTWS